MNTVPHCQPEWQDQNIDGPKDRWTCLLVGETKIYHLAAGLDSSRQPELTSRIPGGAAAALMIALL